ncbi:hypothetical protein AABB24_030347 [Solanum stoloniferum]|uniref:Uncharacterized protein n=1 Tax=Solanum stoloniferum TaxID=62892 RepID=A0ABD2S1N5_9SOLN
MHHTIRMHFSYIIRHSHSFFHTPQSTLLPSLSLATFFSSSFSLKMMTRAVPSLIALFLLFYGLVYQLKQYFLPQSAFHFMEALVTKEGQQAAILILLIIPPYVMLVYSIQQRALVLNAINFLATNGFMLDIISSGFQFSRRIFYEEDLTLIIFISNLFLIFIICLDLFAEKEARIRLMRKIVKRCVYGVVALSYYERMPALIIPLIPATMGAYLIVICFDDPPQIDMIPASWHAHLE